LAAQISGARLAALPGRDHSPYVTDVDAILDEVEAFLTGGRHRPGLDRILSTVLFADIVGSTPRLAEAGDARWAHLLAQHDHLARREIERHRGRHIDSTWDGLLATFDGPARSSAAPRPGVRPLASSAWTFAPGATPGDRTGR
jgi:class 3 adenylate cyclase